MPFRVGRKGKCDGEGVPETQQRMWVAGNRGNCQKAIFRKRKQR